MESRLNYCTILAQQGKSEEARIQFEAAMQLNSNIAPAHLNLTVALAQLNRFDEARDHFRELIHIEPGNAAQRLMRTSQFKQILSALELILNSRGEVPEMDDRAASPPY